MPEPGRGGRGARLIPPAALIADAAATVRAAIGEPPPRAGIVLGSGLGAVADRLVRPVRIAASDIPGMRPATVEGHRGELLWGLLGGVPVLVQNGRLHLYEGHDPSEVVFPVRVMAELGIEILVVTNAAGGVRPSLRAGDLMLISDHVNLTGRNPLVGAVMPGEERFPDMSDAYDSALRRAARTAAAKLGIPLAEGVFAGLLGPSYETPAEVRMLDRLGCDAVAMSTVLEVIVARARGIRCLGLSLIANAAVAPGAVLDHEEVLAAAAEGAGRLGKLVEEILAGAIPSGRNRRR